LSYTIWRLSLACGAAMLTLFGCGTNPCLDIVNQYENEITNAAICDLMVPDSCSVELPTVVGLEANGTFSPENLASNCNAGYNPARSGKLQSLYAEFQAKGCKAEPVPICGNPTNKSQCRQIATSPVCVNGV
jgi:hypothetical protein